MEKTYLFIVLVFVFCLSFYDIQAQANTAQETSENPQEIKGFNIYPNPVTLGDKLFITSNLGLTKTVTIYNVLGKKVLFKVMVGKELDISSLNSGVYIIRVKERRVKEREGNLTTKLVIN